jgi:hypothetical protein
MAKKQEMVSPVSRVLRTPEGLRDALFDELDDLRSGKVNTTHARAVGLIARSILDTVKLDAADENRMKRVTKLLDGNS